MVWNNFQFLILLAQFGFKKKNPFTEMKGHSPGSKDENSGSSHCMFPKAQREKCASGSPVQYHRVNIRLTCGGRNTKKTPLLNTLEDQQ